MGGLEPPLPKETDFESRFTSLQGNSTTNESLFQWVLVQTSFQGFELVYPNLHRKAQPKWLG